MPSSPSSAFVPDLPAAGRSGTKAEESNDSNKPFPHSGNDNHQENPFTIPTRLPGFLGDLFPTPLYHLHPCRQAFACLLQAGWNDDEETRRIPATLSSTFCGMNLEEKV